MTPTDPRASECRFCVRGKCINLNALELRTYRCILEDITDRVLYCPEFAPKTEKNERANNSPTGSRD